MYLTSVYTWKILSKCSTLQKVKKEKFIDRSPKIYLVKRGICKNKWKFRIMFK